MPQEPSESPKTSVYATAAFFTCLGFLFPFLFLAMPVILGIMALSEIRKSNGTIKGRGLAIAAIAIPAIAAVAFFVVLIMSIIAAGPVASHHPKAMDISCLSNLKMIGLSMQMYAEDNGDYLPDSLDNSYIREAVGSDKTFVCPFCRRTGEKYELLPGIGGKKFNDFDNPKDTPVIICRHHRKNDNVLYADGHVAQIPKDGKTSK